MNANQGIIIGFFFVACIDWRNRWVLKVKFINLKTDQSRGKKEMHTVLLMYKGQVLLNYWTEVFLEYLKLFCPSRNHSVGVKLTGL